MAAWLNFDISHTAEWANSDQGQYKLLCPHQLVSSLVKAVVFLSDDKGKLQALTYNTPVSNLWLLLSHPRSSHLWVTICACVCFMYNSAGEVAVYWGEMFWAHSSCCHIRLDFLLGIGWEDTHPGYVGGNLCCVAKELVGLQKSEEKSSCGCWMRSGSHHLLHCWYPLVLMVCCKPPSRVVTSMRASTWLQGHLGDLALTTHLCSDHGAMCALALPAV